MNEVNWPSHSKGWRSLIYRVQYLRPSNLVAPLFITFFQMFARFRTPWARPSLLMFCTDRTDNFISCVVPGPSKWFFHFGEEIVIVWTHIGWVRWMFQNLPLPAMQEVRESSSGVTPCIKNDGVLYHQVSRHASRSPWKHSCILRLRATSILIQERCSSFVNMVLGRSHYPYESQRSYTLQ